MVQTAITVATAKQETDLQRVNSYFERAEIQRNFAKFLGGRGAARYIAEVITTVAGTPALQRCDLGSIYVQALRAATMSMSVDPALGQAYLVPFKVKVGDNWTDRATLIVGYRGLYEMAMRTNKFIWINVTEVYEGEVMEQNRLSGEWKAPSGPRKSDKVVGWLAAYERINHTIKTLYMTIEKIHEHAKKYSKAYGEKYPTSPWQTETSKMERKTVLRLFLRQWGEFTPADRWVLEEIGTDEDEMPGGDALMRELAIRDAAAPEVSVIEDPAPPMFHGIGNSLGQLGFEAVNPDPVKPETMKAWKDLLARAKKVKIPMQNVNLEQLTDGDLREYMARCEAYVANGEIAARA